MELIYQIALGYMIVDILASLYVMIAYRKNIKMRLYSFLNPPQAPEYCCEDDFEFDECDHEEEDELKPRMRRAMDEEFNLK